MSLYTDFVKENHAKYTHLAPKDRMKAIAAAWQAQKGRGAAQKVGPSRLGKGKRAATQEGGGLLDSTGSVWGDLKKGFSLPFQAIGAAVDTIGLKNILPFIL